MELNTPVTLANGAEVVCLDLSKKLAGDRWLVKMRCVLRVPLTGWMEAELAGGGPRGEFLRRELAGGLEFEQLYERNFVDEKERRRVMAGFLERVEANAAGYLGAEAFVRKLFFRRVDALGERWRRLAAAPPPAAVDEDDGPADFSACFT